jgi:hypothetical protein
MMTAKWLAFIYFVRAIIHILSFRKILERLKDDTKLHSLQDTNIGNFYFLFQGQSFHILPSVLGFLTLI